MIKKFIAFTISEILIVVSIVAVVAVFTVPNVKKSHDRKALTAKAKAAMAKLDGAIHQVDINAAINGKETPAARSAAVLEEMANYLKLSSYCGEQGNTLCFSTNVVDTSGTFGSATQPATGGSWSGKPISDRQCATAVLNDGTAFAVCITNFPATSTNAFDVKNYYGYILVDVDGTSVDSNGSFVGVNTRGKDVYAFLISGDGLVLPQQGGVTAQSGFEDAVFDNAANIQ